MIAKSLIAAAAVATMAAAMPMSQAEAKTTIDIDIGFGFGGGYYGGYYDHHHAKPKYISCKKGRKIVDWSGFNKVHAVDCSLPGYKYTAWKKGHKYLVKVNGKGHIYAVNKIF